MLGLDQGFLLDRLVFCFAESADNFRMGVIHFLISTQRIGVLSPVGSASAEAKKGKGTQLERRHMQMVASVSKRGVIAKLAIPVPVNIEDWTVESGQDVKNFLGAVGTDVTRNNQRVKAIGLLRSHLLDGQQVVVNV